MQLTLAPDIPGLVHFQCEGEITLSDLWVGGDPLLDLLGPEGYKWRAVIDMGLASYIDSGGVSLLLRWHGRFLRDGGRMVLYNIPPVVQQVFALLNLQSALHITIDPQMAVTIARS